MVQGAPSSSFQLRSGRGSGSSSTPLIASRARAETEALIRNYRLTPATLYSKLDPTWIPKEFLLYASMKIAQCIAKPNGRLIISWPPRHGKSRLATVATPIWVLENFPEKKVILSTYGDSLSSDFGREVRDIFVSNPHILQQRLRADVKSVGWFLTEKGGGMLSTGLGGAITGKGADVFLIDDYIKTMEEAMSATKRQKDWEWFTGTAYHRLEPGGSMIIIATRWHSDDLIGRIQKHFPGDWEHIKFAAEALPGDPLGRPLGEPLFPERFDTAALNDRKRVLGKIFWSALYQQEPEDAEDQLTDKEWIHVIDRIPTGRRLKLLRIWDFAGRKQKLKRNDPSVGSLVAKDLDTDDFYILDIFRDWRSPKEIENEVELRAEEDGVDTEILIEQEPGASGIQLMAHYQTNVLKGYRMKPVPTTTSKIVRAQPVLAAAEGGKVYLLNRAWTQAWLDEFDVFPADSYHDDQVDTAAIGYNELFGVDLKAPIWGRRITGKRSGTGTILGTRSEDVIVGEPLAADSLKNTQSKVGLTWGRHR